VGESGSLGVLFVRVSVQSYDDGVLGVEDGIGMYGERSPRFGIVWECQMLFVVRLCLHTERHDIQACHYLRRQKVKLDVSCQVAG
jgi:hypothetical protein